MVSSTLPTSELEAPRTVTVWENGTALAFDFADCMKYHGTVFPGGVAHAFAALGSALPALAAQSPTGRVDRRSLQIRTPFSGPGARDVFELVTRAVTEERLKIISDLARPERGDTLARYVFEFSTEEATVTCVLRDEGIVVDEFIQLSSKPGKSEEELARVEVLKVEMRDRILSREPSQVYDLELPAH